MRYGGIRTPPVSRGPWSWPLGHSCIFNWCQMVFHHMQNSLHTRTHTHTHTHTCSCVCLCVCIDTPKHFFVQLTHKHTELPAKLLEYFIRSNKSNINQKAGRDLNDGNLQFRWKSGGFKVGLGISRTKVDSQWNPGYNAIHRFFWCETKRFVGSSVNVILTRQTCGQRSSRAAESKRRALENDFPERICYMFLISKCRGDWDLSWFSFWVLAKVEQREPQREAAVSLRKMVTFVT